jgi:hypothetical protein
MKAILIIVSILFLLLSGVSIANAAVCGSNWRGAGCVGPNGAVVKRHGYGRPVVVVPKKHYKRCAWVNGRKVCRYY